MESVFQWVKNIVYYLIFIRLLLHLMPAGKYEQYMKLFLGAVFILLIISPLTGEFPLQERLAHACEQIRFTQEQEEFQQKLWGMETERTERMIKQYEEAVALDIQEMAKKEGFICLSAGARIEGREEEENFGQITKIYLVIGAEEGEEKQTKEENGTEKMVSIEKVNIVIGEEVRGETDAVRTEAQGYSEEEAYWDGKENKREAVQEFRRKVAEVYGLEETAVQITWQDD